MAIDAGLATLLETVADVAAGHPAIVHAGRRRTWAELDDRAARLAGYLTSRGVARGGRVAIALRNGPEYVETVFAAMKLRAVPVNLNYRYREAELLQVLADSGADALVLDADLSERFAAVLATFPPPGAILRVGVPGGASGGGVPAVPGGGGDPLAGRVTAYEDAVAAADAMPRIDRSGEDEWLMYTGGTTGRPKGVLSTHHWLQRVALSNGYAVVGMPQPADLGDLADGTRALLVHERRPTMLIAPPLMHATGMYNTLGTLLVAGTVVFLDSRRYDADEMAAVIGRHQVSDLSLVGDVFARPFADALDRAAADGHPYDLSTLRRMVSVGVLWSSEVKERLLRYCDAVIEDTIAASEGGPFARSVTTRGRHGVTSRFELIPGVRVIGDDGTDVVPGSGHVGRLAAPAGQDVRYLGDAAATAASFPVIDGQRYCAPGDLATIEADGSVYLLGRGSRVINTGGEKVFAEEVEQAVTSHPAIEDAYVVGMPDERFGQRIVAVVAVRPGAQPSAEEIRDHVGELLAGYKRPRSVVFVPELRRSPSGKADLRWARKVAEAAVSGRQPGPER
jgi:3-oxocholest-4-en-26-oate---CoA ligase